MTQDERWYQQYSELVEYMETYHRRPSKHFVENRNLYHWWRHNSKLYAKGELPAHRVEKFKNLIEIANKYKHKNQYE